MGAMIRRLHFILGRGALVATAPTESARRSAAQPKSKAPKAGAAPAPKVKPARVK
jgi:hypothetical protein